MSVFLFVKGFFESCEFFGWQPGRLRYDQQDRYMLACFDLSAVLVLQLTTGVRFEWDEDKAGKEMLCDPSHR